jgi:hypothetical protein
MGDLFAGLENSSVYMFVFWSKPVLHFPFWVCNVAKAFAGSFSWFEQA